MPATPQHYVKRLASMVNGQYPQTTLEDYIGELDGPATCGFTCNRRALSMKKPSYPPDKRPTAEILIEKPFLPNCIEIPRRKLR